MISNNNRFTRSSSSMSNYSDIKLIYDEHQYRPCVLVLNSGNRIILVALYTINVYNNC